MEKVLVDAKALRQVLMALTGPPHLIRELQVLQNLHPLLAKEPNPINILTDEFNRAVEEFEKINQEKGQEIDKER